MAVLHRLAGGALLLLLAACDSPSTPPPPPPPPQTPAEWLAANAHPISSLSAADRDFRDLQPLKAAIGSARVVMLGEQSHGDGTTFLAKARLIAFLHQEMGFDVLAWESGLYDVHQVWRHVLAGEDVLSAARRGIFGVWNRSEQVLPTFDYVASTLGTARPLELAGFDNQTTGSLARDSVAAHVQAFARRIGSAVADDPEWPAAAATLTELAVTQHFDFKPPAADQARLLRLLGALRADASARAAGDREALFWTQALESLASYASMMWAAPPGQFRAQDSNVRDTQMARNLLWLADVYYPGRKIIVWAASAHVAREVTGLALGNGFQPFATGWTVHMGDEVHRVLGSQMYAIGFTAATGSFGPAGAAPQAIPPVTPGSLEAYFTEAGLANAFVDFRAPPAGGEWLRNVSTRAFGYGDLRGDWTRVLDGMVFTREMIPSTTASR
ncbi:MAG TPA: erythromycin esterase family protein [Longimicrobium sp.]|jgi:erythromycin esterase